MYIDFAVSLSKMKERKLEGSRYVFQGKMENMQFFSVAHNKIVCLIAVRHCEFQKNTICHVITKRNTKINLVFLKGSYGKIKVSQM
jgi:hypothetical protein